MHTKPVSLAIETASRIGSIALGSQGALLAENRFSGPLRHSAEIFPTLLGLLRAQGLEAGAITEVYLSIGPGSFTGLRIAVTIAKTIHLAQPCNIVAVSTLEVLANGTRSLPEEIPGHIVPVLDAKRGQFFTALFRRKHGDHGLERCTDDCLRSAEEILGQWAVDNERPIALLGDGLVYHQEKFTNPNVHILPEKHWSPQARDVFEIGHQKSHAGDFTDPLTLTPNYLREALVTPKCG